MQVQLHQLKVALPALIPQAIVIAVVAAKIDVEPIPVGGVFPVAQHILKGPEAAAHMVEHAVQHHPDTGLMQSVAHLFKILVAAQTAIDFAEISSIIAVVVGFKHWGESK